MEIHRFNSRTLGRVRLSNSIDMITDTRFQFTHPGKGATSTQHLIFNLLACFNSRTLGRVRLKVITEIYILPMFQFTHPGKGATYTRTTEDLSGIGFNSRTLGRVRRERSWICSAIPIRFNSRTLGRVRPYAQRASPSTAFCFNSRTLGRVRRISILVGLSHARFNSRTLGRVRLNTTNLRSLYSVVSIHAPWEGCDYTTRLYRSDCRCFNSRTLGRVRPVFGLNKPNTDLFQFTHPGKGAT